METVGPSATVPGIVIDVEPRPAYAHAKCVEIRGTKVGGNKNNNTVEEKKLSNKRDPWRSQSEVEGERRDDVYGPRLSGQPPERGPRATHVT